MFAVDDAPLINHYPHLWSNPTNVQRKANYNKRWSTTVEVRLTQNEVAGLQVELITAGDRRGGNCMNTVSLGIHES
jgi:hypothetical protein